MAETSPPALPTAIFGFPPREVARWNALGLFYQIPGGVFEHPGGFQMAAGWAPEISPSPRFFRGREKDATLRPRKLAAL